MVNSNYPVVPVFKQSFPRCLLDPVQQPVFRGEIFAGKIEFKLPVLFVDPFLHDGRMNLQFRSEFFNMFNRVRFGDPGLAFGSPQFGVVTSQVNSPRKIQLSLKLLY